MLILVMASALITLTACSPDATSDQEEDMTPDAALANLRTASLGLLGAVSPDAPVDEATPKDVPCGGIGGNEWSSIRFDYTATAGESSDPEATLEAAEAALTELGLRNDGRGSTGTGPVLRFSGEGFSAMLRVHQAGTVQMIGNTDCLDNPDR